MKSTSPVSQSEIRGVYQLEGELKVTIGPFLRDRIALCSADAGPGSQRDYPCKAGYFFPGGKWVGAVRNAAERLRCDFYILLTRQRKT